MLDNSYHIYVDSHVIPSIHSYYKPHTQKNPPNPTGFTMIYFLFWYSGPHSVVFRWYHCVSLCLLTVFRKPYVVLWMEQGGTQCKGSTQTSSPIFMDHHSGFWVSFFLSRKLLSLFHKWQVQPLGPPSWAVELKSNLILRPGRTKSKRSPH